jgi:O-methyltransferase
VRSLKDVFRHRYRRASFAFSDMPESFWDLHARCHHATMSSAERLYALYEAVRYVVARNIPGDIVECGVWRGGSMMMAAYTLRESGETGRRLWLYDTFTGMSDPTGLDIEAPTGRLANPRDHYWCEASEEVVRQNMAATGYPTERVQYVRGKVEDTIPARVPNRIALLRLDTDFYESTHHELAHLWPRVEPGGVLILDDYGWWEGARRAVDEYFADRPILLNRLDITGRMAVKT